MHAGEVSAIGKRSTAKGVSLFVFDACLYIACLTGVILVEALWLKIALSFLTGFAISFLFLVGHDACHHSLTPKKWLNRIIGRLAFMPSLHPFSLWDLGHNQVHHRYTNLRTKDYVWRPLTFEEYERAPFLQRAEYRFYRTPIGCLFYFLIDIWWRRMFFYELTVTPRRSIYSKDRWLVLAYLVALGAFVFGVDWIASGQVVGTLGHYVVLVTTAVVWPFLLWNLLASLLIFLHHTHASVRWYFDETDYSYATAQLENSVHWVFPGPIEWFLHRIMSHTAHHVNPAVPCYELQNAQECLEREHESSVIVQPWSFGAFLDVASRCKLYDFDRHAWIDFDGNLTTTPRATVETSGESR